MCWGKKRKEKKNLLQACKSMVISLKFLLEGLPNSRETKCTVSSNGTETQLFFFYIFDWSYAPAPVSSTWPIITQRPIFSVCNGQASLNLIISILECRQLPHVSISITTKLKNVKFGIVMLGLTWYHRHRFCYWWPIKFKQSISATENQPSLWNFISSVHLTRRS